MTLFWNIIDRILSRCGILISYLLSLICFIFLSKSSITIPKEILGINTILSALLAFVAFIFSVRTFLVFKLKDLYDKPEEIEQFQNLIQQGMCQKDADYYGPLKELDRLFDNILIGISIITFIIVFIQIINAFWRFEKLYFLCELFGITSIILATLMILLSGHITNNIINGMQINKP